MSYRTSALGAAAQKADLRSWGFTRADLRFERNLGGQFQACMRSYGRETDKQSDQQIKIPKIQLWSLRRLAIADLRPERSDLPKMGLRANVWTNILKLNSVAKQLLIGRYWVKYWTTKTALWTLKQFSNNWKTTFRQLLYNFRISLGQLSKNCVKIQLTIWGNSGVNLAQL